MNKEGVGFFQKTCAVALCALFVSVACFILMSSASESKTVTLSDAVEPESYEKMIECRVVSDSGIDGSIPGLIRESKLVVEGTVQSVEYTHSGISAWTKYNVVVDDVLFADEQTTIAVPEVISVFAPGGYISLFDRVEAMEAAGYTDVRDEFTQDELENTVEKQVVDDSEEKEVGSKSVFCLVPIENYEPWEGGYEVLAGSRGVLDEVSVKAAGVTYIAENGESYSRANLLACIDENKNA